VSGGRGTAARQGGRRAGPAGLLALALVLVLGLASGCATTATRESEEATRRRAKAHFDLGVDHLGDGRLAMALRELRSAAELSPDNPRIHYALGDAYLRKGLTAEAESHLRRALAIHPEYHDARLHLSAVYIHLKRYDEAIAQSQILVDDPTFPAPWRALTNRGWAQLESGRVEAARRSLEEALRYNRKYWPALLDLGILEARAGHNVAAIQHFRRVLELSPGPGAEAETNYRMAEIYVALGKRDRAVEHLRTAVTRAPTEKWGRRSEEYLQLLR